MSISTIFHSLQSSYLINIDILKVDLTFFIISSIYSLLSVKVKVAQSCPTLFDPVDNSPGQNTGVGSLPLLQATFPTQELNRGLLHSGRLFPG